MTNLLYAGGVIVFPSILEGKTGTVFSKISTYKGQLKIVGMAQYKKYTNENNSRDNNNKQGDSLHSPPACTQFFYPAMLVIAF